MAYPIADATLADALSSVPITPDLLVAGSDQADAHPHSHASARSDGQASGTPLIDPDLHSQYTYHDADAQSEFYHHQVQPSLSIGSAGGASGSGAAADHGELSGGPATGSASWHDAYAGDSSDPASATHGTHAAGSATQTPGGKKPRGEKRKRTYAIDRPVNSLADLVDHTPAQILSGPPEGDITLGPIYIRPLGGASQACVRCHRIKRKCDFAFGEATPADTADSSLPGAAAGAGPGGTGSTPQGQAQGEQKKRCSGCARSGVPCVFEVTAATVRYIEELTAERDALARRVKELEGYDGKVLDLLDQEGALGVGVDDPSVAGRSHLDPQESAVGGAHGGGGYGGKLEDEGDVGATHGSGRQDMRELFDARAGYQ